MSRPVLQITPDTSNSVRGGWSYFRQRDFTGGENKQLLPEFMGQNQLISAQNCVMSAEGVPETRFGKYLSSSVTDAGAITAMFRYSKANGNRYLAVQIGTAVHAFAWTGTGTITSLGTAVKTLSSSAKLRGVVWKDALLLTNGVDNPFSITHNGSAFVVADLNASDAPKSKIIKVYGNRLWLVDVANPNNLRYSALEDYTSWDALDVIQVRDGDGDIVMNLSPQDGGMVILKSKSIWTLYGTSKSDFRIPNTPLYMDGLVGNDAVVDEGMFLSSSTLYQFSLTSVQPVFASHKPTIASLTAAEIQATMAFTDRLEKRILFHFGSGDTLCIQEQNRPDTQERYYAAFTWTGLNPGAFAALDDRADSGDMLVGDATVTKIYTLNNDIDDDGTSIETIIETAYNDHNEIGQKVWRRFSPEIEIVNVDDAYTYSLTYDVDYSALSGLERFVDQNDNIMVWDRSNWDDKYWGFKERVGESIHFAATGNRISFGIKSNDRLKFLGYTAKYRTKEIK